MLQEFMRFLFISMMKVYDNFQKAEQQALKKTAKDDCKRENYHFERLSNCCLHRWIVFSISGVQRKVVGICSKLHNGHLHGIQWLVGGEGGGSLSRLGGGEGWQ